MAGGLLSKFTDYLYFEKQRDGRELFAELMKRFLVAVFLFGAAYCLLTIYSPQNGIANANPGTLDLAVDSVYFSVNTISTLGYGDIVPLGFSKVLVSIEVVIGLLIFGIGVARMISIKSEKLMRDVSKDEHEIIKELRAKKRGK